MKNTMQQTENATGQAEQQKSEFIMHLHVTSGDVSKFQISKCDNGWKQYSYRILADDKDIDGIEASNDQEAVTKGLVKISEVLGKISDAKKVLAEYLR